ncbi:MAG TPA: VOC family protein [Polyangiales bacterium]|nr:VOC family protein [Polyangiales bacterium]
MVDAIRLGYLVFETARLPRWREFCSRLLGLPEPLANPDGSLGYQLDDAAAQRLIVAPGAREELGAIGLECASEAALARVCERVSAAGVGVSAASEAVRAARRVQRVCHFQDPAGNRIEAFVAPEAPEAGFASEHFPLGFETGELGMGHAALIVRDVAATERFYVGVLGFGVSERLAKRIGSFELRGVFLHCNRRHHSLALFNLPLSRRLHHFMLQARELRAVGLAFERARALGVPLSLSLGQHADPDSTFSFYGVTPSGSEFEIGAGSREIEPAHWREIASDTTSAWGHEPTLRLKLQTARGLIAARLQAGMR